MRMLSLIRLFLYVFSSCSRRSVSIFARFVVDSTHAISTCARRLDTLPRASRQNLRYLAASSAKGNAFDIVTCPARKAIVVTQMLIVMLRSLYITHHTRSSSPDPLPATRNTTRKIAMRHFGRRPMIPTPSEEQDSAPTVCTEHSIPMIGGHEPYNDLVESDISRLTRQTKTPCRLITFPQLKTDASGSRKPHVRRPRLFTSASADAVTRLAS